MSSEVIPKMKTAVTVHLQDGTSQHGHAFVGHGQRIVDALNDSRTFLPFECEDGLLVVLSKAAIHSLVPAEQAIQREEPLPRWLGPRWASADYLKAG